MVQLATEITEITQADLQDKRSMLLVIDLFSLYILFSQCRSCDVPKGIS